MTESLLPILSQIADQNRIASAYLLTGTNSQKLKTQALLFAKRLNCLKPPLCNECLSCKKIERLVHPDVKLIESQEETIKIDTLRELQRELHLKPFEGEWKVVIINGAQYLNAASSNSMLKILEEPPSQTVFLLLTSHLENLLSTIVSRCNLIRFKESLNLSLPEIDFVQEILSLPSQPEELFELSKKISKDDIIFQACLETWITWYHDLLFYKQGLTPIASPLKDKEVLGKNLSLKLSSQHIYDHLKTVLETKKYLNFQLNRELLAENLLFKLSS